MFELLVAVPRGGSRVGFSSASLLRRVSYHQMMSSQVCMIANRDFEKLAVIGRHTQAGRCPCLYHSGRTSELPQAHVGGGGEDFRHDKVPLLQPVEDLFS